MEKCNFFFEKSENINNSSLSVSRNDDFLENYNSMLILGRKKSIKINR